MPGTPTSRRSLPTLDAAADLVSAYPATNLAQMNNLDTAMDYLQGTLVSRPLANAVLAGTVYRATDTGVYYLSTGSAWLVMDVGLFGSSIIAASESTSSASYTTLTSPDQVSGVTLPSSGLIQVWYQAAWTEPAANVARAAIFLNSTQLQVQSVGDAGPVPSAAATAASLPSSTVPLATCSLGLVSMTASGAIAADVTTGQALGVFSNSAFVGAEIGGTVYHLATPGGYGGPCSIFAAAGTYTVSVKFKTSVAGLAVANRRLYVRVVPFG